MIKTEIASPSIENIGQDIGQELGAKMVKDFQDTYPNEIHSYLVGRKIIDQLLQQPNCAGIRFYAALNEFGEKTFVYVGVNQNNEVINQYTTIGNDGKLVQHTGVVGDRFKPGGAKDTSVATETTWSWM